MADIITPGQCVVRVLPFTTDGWPSGSALLTLDMPSVDGRHAEVVLSPDNIRALAARLEEF
jgi:hypothetical protein